MCSSKPNKSVFVCAQGAGTWEYNNTVAYDSVCKSFAAGYNFVDTADDYNNEQGVGDAIRDCWIGAGKVRVAPRCVACPPSPLS